jgi:hypothetical protein
VNLDKEERREVGRLAEKVEKKMAKKEKNWNFLEEIDKILKNHYLLNLMTNSCLVYPIPTYPLDCLSFLLKNWPNIPLL